MILNKSSRKTGTKTRRNVPRTRKRVSRNFSDSPTIASSSRGTYYILIYCVLFSICGRRLRNSVARLRLTSHLRGAVVNAVVNGANATVVNTLLYYNISGIIYGRFASHISKRWPLACVYVLNNTRVLLRIN